jgi:hypothetical protein
MMASTRRNRHRTCSVFAFFDRDLGKAELLDHPGVRSQMARDAVHSEGRPPVGERGWRQQLVAEVRIEGSLRCMMRDQSQGGFVGHVFRTASAPADGGESGKTVLIDRRQKDPSA